MKVRLLTSLSGVRGTFNVGEEYECDAGEAGRLIERGFAEPVREKKVERATRKPRTEKAKK